MFSKIQKNKNSQIWHFKWFSFKHCWVSVYLCIFILILQLFCVCLNVSVFILLFFLKITGFFFIVLLLISCFAFCNVVVYIYWFISLTVWIWKKNLIYSLCFNVIYYLFFCPSYLFVLSQIVVLVLLDSRSIYFRANFIQHWFEHKTQIFFWCFSGTKH